MYKTAICLTTFLRPELCGETLKNYLQYLPDDTCILIADQSHKDAIITFHEIHEHVFKFNLPYDCGLSYARNFLVEVAAKRNIPYCLISADSIQFSEKQNFDELYGLMNNPHVYQGMVGIVGLELRNRCSWEYDMNLIPGEYFILTKPSPSETFLFQKVDICKNFFLAKTRCLIENPWDNELKLAEHEDFFWRLKQTQWKVLVSIHNYGIYIDSKPDEYLMMRNRMYNIFRDKLRQKYGIKGWVKIVK